MAKLTSAPKYLPREKPKTQAERQCPYDGAKLEENSRENNERFLRIRFKPCPICSRIYEYYLSKTYPISSFLPVKEEASS